MAIVTNDEVRGTSTVRLPSTVQAFVSTMCEASPMRTGIHAATFVAGGFEGQESGMFPPGWRCGVVMEEFGDFENHATGGTAGWAWTSDGYLRHDRKRTKWAGMSNWVCGDRLGLQLNVEAGTLDALKNGQPLGRLANLPIPSPGDSRGWKWLVEMFIHAGWTATVSRAATDHGATHAEIYRSAVILR